MALSDQDQEAWEIYCDEGGPWPDWETLSEDLKTHYRRKANAARIERSAPWRHP